MRGNVYFGATEVSKNKYRPMIEITSDVYGRVTFHADIDLPTNSLAAEFCKAAYVALTANQENFWHDPEGRDVSR